MEGYEELDETLLIPEYTFLFNSQRECKVEYNQMKLVSTQIEVT